MNTVNTMSTLMRLIALTLLVFTFSLPVHAAPHLSVDLDSGNVLSQKQAFDPWHPASLTKLMTAFVVFRAIDAGEITADSPVRISRRATKEPPSKMGYRAGTILSMENALKILLVKSANDVSVAIAEAAGGSVSKFANRMNREASRLGMTGSRFVNPHGLHDARQVTTAHDMALLVRAIHKRFPQYSKLFSTPSIIAPKRGKSGKTIKRVYFSYNLLLERFRGGDGFKTGFVCASGYNFIGSATRSGRRIAAIVLGRDSQTSRAVDAAKLITEGFQQPVTFGKPIGSLTANGPVANSARNMRPIMCSQEARAKRYEPGAGQAVIKSAWLQRREITKQPLNVTLVGFSKQARPTSVPLPVFRPFDTAQLRSSETILTPAATIDAKPVKTNSAGKVPLPAFRPQSL